MNIKVTVLPELKFPNTYSVSDFQEKDVLYMYIAGNGSECYVCDMDKLTWKDLAEFIHITNGNDEVSLKDIYPLQLNRLLNENENNMMFSCGWNTHDNFGRDCHGMFSFHYFEDESNEMIKVANKNNLIKKICSIPSKKDALEVMNKTLNISEYLGEDYYEIFH